MWLQSSGSFLSRKSHRIGDGNRKDLKSRTSRVSDCKRFSANQPGLFSAGNSHWWEPLQIKMMHDCRLREFQSVWHYSSAARWFLTPSGLEAARQEVQLQSNRSYVMTITFLTFLQRCVCERVLSKNPIKACWGKDCLTQPSISGWQ